MTSTSGLGTTIDHPAIRSQRATSTAPRRTCRPRSTRRAGYCRRTCRTRRPTARPTRPTAPILIYAVHSDALPIYRVDDYAYTILAQRISTVAGVSQVDIAGQQHYAVHVQVNPAALAARGIGLEDVRNALSAATAQPAKGNLEGAHQTVTLDTNDQLFNAAAFRNVIVAYRNGAPVRVKDVGRRRRFVDQNARTGAWFNGKPAELLLIQRQAGANTIERRRPRSRRMMPAAAGSRFPPSVHVDLVSDRSLVHPRLRCMTCSSR